MATRWTKETNVQRIIVVSDEVANDHVRKTLLTQVAPPGVTAHVVDVDKMVRVWNNPKYGQDRVMLLFTNPTDVLRVVEQGVDIKTVNIGGMAFRQGKLRSIMRSRSMKKILPHSANSMNAILNWKCVKFPVTRN